MAQEEKQDKIRCPGCWGHDIVPARQGGFLDWLHKKALEVPVQCRFCGKRFYVLSKETA